MSTLNELIGYNKGGVEPGRYRRVDGTPLEHGGLAAQVLGEEKFTSTTVLGLTCAASIVFGGMSETTAISKFLTGLGAVFVGSKIIDVCNNFYTHHYGPYDLSRLDQIIIDTKPSAPTQPNLYSIAKDLRDREFRSTTVFGIVTLSFLTGIIASSGATPTATSLSMSIMALSEHFSILSERVQRLLMFQKVLNGEYSMIDEPPPRWYAKPSATPGEGFGEPAPA